LAALAVLCCLGEAFANGTPSVGIAGPPQVFTGLTGENLTSYVRIYNDGNATGSYRLEVHGNVSSITVLESRSFSIEAGSNRRVSIVYVAPVEPRYFEGELVALLEGQQIMPGVTKEISITVARSPENRAPWVRIVSPREGQRLSGDVDVMVEGGDPDGDEVSFLIYIDGALVSEKATYLWETRRWLNGQHELRALASDTNLTSDAAILFVLENARRAPWVYLVGGLAAVVAFVVLLVLLVRRHRALQ